MADQEGSIEQRKRGGVAGWMREHLLVSLTGALILGAMIGMGAGSETEPATSTADDADGSDPAVEEPEEEETEALPPPEPEYDTPTKDDFKLRVRKLSEECFGSAGCNTDIRVILVATGDIELDPTKTYELRYRIVGADDQLLATTEITGDDYTVNEHYISTRAGADLQAIVLSVSEF
jgi:hypothetical protein